MEGPVERMDAHMFLELLAHHSDIDPISLTALACTSKPLRDAVDELWPVKAAKYAEREKGRPPILLPEDDARLTDVYPSIENACDYYASRTEFGSQTICFEFQDEGSNLSRSTAMMPVATARKKYFLGSKDLSPLQSFKSTRGCIFYAFDDVLLAAMVRYGRGELVKHMLAIAGKLQQRIDRKYSRRQAVNSAANAIIGMHDMLTPNALRSYTDDFIETGVGGMRRVWKRLVQHHMFLRIVSAKSMPSTPFPPLLTAEEQRRVAHLQVDYVLTQNEAFIREAARIIEKQRLFGGV